MYEVFTIIGTGRVPVEGKSSLCVMCIKYRIIILIIIIISLFMEQRAKTAF